MNWKRTRICHFWWKIQLYFWNKKWWRWRPWKISPERAMIYSCSYTLLILVKRPECNLLHWFHASITPAWKSISKPSAMWLQYYHYSDSIGKFWKIKCLICVFWASKDMDQRKGGSGGPPPGNFEELPPPVPTALFLCLCLPQKLKFWNLTRNKHCPF